MRKLFLLIIIFAMPFAVFAQESPFELTCSDGTIDGAEVGDIYEVECPSDCSEGSIWGTDVYTDDSTICTAAAHAGVIELEDGGEFTIFFIDGQDEYEASEQNDIESSSWGSWDISFTFDYDMEEDELEPIEIDWDTAGNELPGITGAIYYVACPEDGDEGSLWGTEIYTDDSSVCTAAVHMDLIDLDDGGEFFLLILDGEEEYEGSEENDIDSSDWGSWSRSFAVTDGDIELESLEIDWDTAANELPGDTEAFYYVECPEDGDEGSLWGTEIYTDDSSICTAAVHMDIIDLDDGGEFFVIILDGEDEYEGSEENDIDSSDWGSYARSFAVSE